MSKGAYMFEPRMPTSAKHLPQNLPLDLAGIIRESLLQKYTFFSDKDLIVQGAIYPEELILLVGFKEKKSLRQFNFECSIGYHNDEEAVDSGVLEKFHKGADSLDVMINEYIEAAGDIEMPKTWSHFNFENEQVYLKTSNINTEVEKMTMNFLSEHGLQDEQFDQADLH